ncbi:hypothetical protein B0H15DRAFT_800077 [Mycena belliarum]|uniref:Uncharacterized protein n=1 Tax=Mycena belliarum TaxID=1033014 RepID=A0AAD6XVJ1_9AGAR|nr:hypothetical protein B0H15DRAFT_800077 [Mycena belliae]
MQIPPGDILHGSKLKDHLKASNILRATKASPGNIRSVQREYKPANNGSSVHRSLRRTPASVSTLRPRAGRTTLVPLINSLYGVPGTLPTRRMSSSTSGPANSCGRRASKHSFANVEYIQNDLGMPEETISKKPGNTVR